MTRSPTKRGEVKSKVVRSTGHSHVTLSWEDPDAGTLSNLKKINWGKMKDTEMKDIDWSLYVQDGLSDEENQREELEGEEEQDLGEEEESEQINTFRNNNKKDRASNNDLRNGNHLQRGLRFGQQGQSQEVRRGPKKAVEKNQEEGQGGKQT